MIPGTLPGVLLTLAKLDDELGLTLRAQNFNRSHGKLTGLSNTRDIFSLQMAQHFSPLNIFRDTF